LKQTRPRRATVFAKWKYSNEISTVPVTVSQRHCSGNMPANWWQAEKAGSFILFCEKLGPTVFWTSTSRSTEGCLRETKFTQAVEIMVEPRRLELPQSIFTKALKTQAFNGINGVNRFRRFR